jgi:hypothetical protein
MPSPFHLHFVLFYHVCSGVLDTIIAKNRAKRDNETVSVDMAVCNTVRKWGEELQYGRKRNWVSRVVWLKAGIWKL